MLISAAFMVARVLISKCRRCVVVSTLRHSARFFLASFFLPLLLCPCLLSCVSSRCLRVSSSPFSSSFFFIKKIPFFSVVALLRFPGINEIVGVLLLKVRSCNWNFGEEVEEEEER